MVSHTVVFRVYVLQVFEGAFVVVVVVVFSLLQVMSMVTVVVVLETDCR